MDRNSGNGYNVTDFNFISITIDNKSRILWYPKS